MATTRTTITTAKSVEKLKPREERYSVPDTGVKGLELRVQPDGVKVWSLRYRVHGQQRRLKLGVYDDQRMSLADARTAANKALRAVDGGIDPQAEKVAKRRAAAGAKVAAELAQRDTVEELCKDYIENYAKERKRTWRSDQTKINGEILPAWRGCQVGSITRRDCLALVQGIAKRGAKVYANRVGALLSTLFGRAVRAELIQVNPAWRLEKQGVEFQARPAGEQPNKPYTEDEIRAIWSATASLEPAPRALYRIGLITGQRAGEISGMKWDEIDKDWWTIPSIRSKNRKDHRVYLTALALEALQDVPRIVDEPLLFKGRRGKRLSTELNATVFAKVRPRAKPKHALRDTAATGMAAAGVPVDDISRVLNHATGLKVTQGYNSYSYDREKMIALSAWSRRLASIIEDKEQEAATVVSIVR